MIRILLEVVLDIVASILITVMIYLDIVRGVDFDWVILVIYIAILIIIRTITKVILLLQALIG